MNSSSWQSVPLLSCVDEIIDFRGKTPKKIGMEWGNGSIKALSANNVKQGYIDFKRECYLASEELYEAWMTKGDCSKDDIVFTMEAPLGNVALIPDDSKYILSQRVILLKPNKLVDSKYLFHFMSSDSFQNELNANATGSTAKGIKQTRLVKLKVTLPPLLEQQKIAEVLSTVDKKIDLIDQKIAETEKLKTGLMQKLFSEGVGVQDSDGNWQPHSEFQDSPFGKIPKCWSVETLGEHTVKVGSGVTPKGGSKAYVDSGIPLIRSQNVLFGKFKLDDVAFITEQQHDKMKGSKLQPRDVLLNITGASIGRCAVLPEDFDEGNVNQHVCIIRTSESIDPDFCGWFLNSNLGQKQIWNLQAGGNREGLNFQQIRSFKIPVFSIEEQCSIVEILSTVSDRLNLLETQKAETQQLKKGLMQKLLTGEWRVPLDNPEAA